MKRYQLIGNKRILQKKKSFDINYSEFHFHSLPLELLVEIFGYLADDLKAILKIALVCKKFNYIINKYFLYKRIVFQNEESLEKFSSAHLPNSSYSFAKLLRLNETSTKVNLIQSCELYRPPAKENRDFTTNIAGSYRLDITNKRDSRTNYHEYISFLLTFIKEAYGLKTLIFSDIRPTFHFPKSSYDGSSSLKHRRRLNKLVLKAQDGWSIPFKVSHISLLVTVFGEIDELELIHFILDNESLKELDQNLVISKLKVNSCIFSSANRSVKKPCGIFRNTTVLELWNIQSGNDLSVIDLVRPNGKLSELILDMGSASFYKIIDNERVLNFAKYNIFFELISSGKGSYSTITNLKLVNFDLFTIYGHVHDTENTNASESIYSSSGNLFEKFLVYLSQVQELTIVLKSSKKSVKTCIKCGHTKNNIDDKKEYHSLNLWKSLLRPMIASETQRSTRILTSKGEEIFKLEK